jgi:excisionase family DNA binding protein
MAKPNIESEELMTPREVGQLFRVDAKTVTRWAKDGKLNYIRTLGGHRRYRASEMHAFLQAGTQPRDVTPPEPDLLG